MQADAAAYLIVAQALLVDLGDLVDDLLVLKDENPPRQADDLRHVRRDQNDRLALFGRQVPQQAVNLCLGLDIHPDGGLIDDQDVAAGRQPLAQADLLLIAAAEVSYLLLQTRRANIQRRDQRLRGLGLRPVVNPAGELADDPLPYGNA